VLELRQPWWRLCLLAPFYDSVAGGLFFGGLLVTVALALAGIWAAVPIAAVAIVLFEVRSAGVCLRADGAGIHVRNRFRSHDVAWADVLAIVLSEPGPLLSVNDLRPMLRVQGRREPGRGIALLAAMGMGRSELEELGSRLVELGRISGFEIAGPPAGPAAEAAGP
jgi:hypothetical protein